MGGAIITELTNRCNLSCRHCFSGRHGGRDDLSLDALRKVLDEAKHLGFGHLSFTGGDPTVHPRFAEVLQMTGRAGYRFSMVTNGWNFVRVYPSITAQRDALTLITFSLDGATETTHNELRGKGSFRRVLQAFSVCMAEDLPFTINMVVTRHNRHEIRDMAQLAMQLGSRGVRFGHLMPSRLTTARGFDLSPEERKVVEREIWSLRPDFPIAIAMGPGYHTTSLFPCMPLQMREINIDCRGNVTKCCHLSSHGDGAGQGDVVGNLRDISFGEALRRLREANDQLRAEKLQRKADGALSDSDLFPCWYCSLSFDKVDWLKQLPDHPWTPLMWAGASPKPIPVARTSS